MPDTSPVCASVLLVEDEDSIRYFYSSCLTKAGHRVLTANDGEEGLAMIEKERPDIVLLDVRMPKKDGYSVLKELKEKKSSHSPKVIMFTCLSQPADRERALMLGAHDYLVKTEVRVNDVLEKIKEHLRP